MKLTVISHTSLHSYQIEWLEVETTHGNYVIQLGHVPTILAAKPGKTIVYQLTSGAQVTVSVKSALLDISRTAITLLVHML